jgi:hypothetical protein
MANSTMSKEEMDTILAGVERMSTEEMDAALAQMDPSEMDTILAAYSDNPNAAAVAEGPMSWPQNVERKIAERRDFLPDAIKNLGEGLSVAPRTPGQMHQGTQLALGTLQGAGAITQRIAGGLTAPLLALQQGEGIGAIPKRQLQSLTGERLPSFGDLLTGAGAPDWVADPVSFIGELATSPPIPGGGKVATLVAEPVKAVGKLLKGIPMVQKMGLGIKKAARTFVLKVLQQHPDDLIDDLVNTGFKTLKKGGKSAPFDTAEALTKDLNTLERLANSNYEIMKKAYYKTPVNNLDEMLSEVSKYAKEKPLDVQARINEVTSRIRNKANPPTLGKGFTMTGASQPVEFGEVYELLQNLRGAGQLEQSAYKVAEKSLAKQFPLLAEASDSFNAIRQALEAGERVIGKRNIPTNALGPLSQDAAMAGARVTAADRASGLHKWYTGGNRAVAKNLAVVDRVLEQAGMPSGYSASAKTLSQLKAFDRLVPNLQGRSLAQSVTYGLVGAAAGGAGISAYGSTTGNKTAQQFGNLMGGGSLALLGLSSPKLLASTIRQMEKTKVAREVIKRVVGDVTAAGVQRGIVEANSNQ